MARRRDYREPPEARDVFGHALPKPLKTTSRRGRLSRAIPTNGCRETARAARTPFGSASYPHPESWGIKSARRNPRGPPSRIFPLPDLINTTPASEKLLNFLAAVTETGRKMSVCVKLRRE